MRLGISAAASASRDTRVVLCEYNIIYMTLSRVYYGGDEIKLNYNRS